MKSESSIQNPMYWCADKRNLIPGPTLTHEAPQLALPSYLVLSAILLAGSGGVTTANHGDDTLASRLHNCIHQLLGASNGSQAGTADPYPQTNSASVPIDSWDSHRFRVGVPRNWAKFPLFFTFTAKLMLICQARIWPSRTLPSGHSRW